MVDSSMMAINISRAVDTSIPVKVYVVQLAGDG